jgi:hypothetical protein
LVALEYEPSLHGTASDAPLSQWWPGVQGSHSFWPGWSWKVPAAHLAHAPMLALAATEPAAHRLGKLLNVDA